MSILINEVLGQLKQKRMDLEREFADLNVHIKGLKDRIEKLGQEISILEMDGVVVDYESDSDVTTMGMFISKSDAVHNLKGSEKDKLQEEGGDKEEKVKGEQQKDKKKKKKKGGVFGLW